MQYVTDEKGYKHVNTGVLVCDLSHVTCFLMSDRRTVKRLISILYPSSNTSTNSCSNRVKRIKDIKQTRFSLKMDIDVIVDVPMNNRSREGSGGSLYLRDIICSFCVHSLIHYLGIIQ